jgi:hypothetical protein
MLLMAEGGMVCGIGSFRWELENQLLKRVTEKVHVRHL